MSDKRFSKAVSAVKNSNMFIVGHSCENDIHKYELCSKEKTYSITISDKLECTCLDHVNRKCICKHIYFILLKIHRIVLEPSDLNLNDNQRKLLLSTYDKFFKPTNMRNKNSDCVICIEKMIEHDILYVCSVCNNGYHYNCIDEYKKYNDKCPLCRSSLQV